MSHQASTKKCLCWLPQAAVGSPVAWGPCPTQEAGAVQGEKASPLPAANRRAESFVAVRGTHDGPEMRGLICSQDDSPQSAPERCAWLPCRCLGRPCESCAWKTLSAACQLQSCSWSLHCPAAHPLPPLWRQGPSSSAGCAPAAWSSAGTLFITKGITQAAAVEVKRHLLCRVQQSGSSGQQVTLCSLGAASL